MAAKAGKVEAVDGAFRAHVQYRGVTGEKQHIEGPRRKIEARAQSDLDSMRGAAAEYSNDRMEAYELHINTLSHPQMRKVYFFFGAGRFLLGPWPFCHVLSAVRSSLAKTLPTVRDN